MRTAAICRSGTCSSIFLRLPKPLAWKRIRQELKIVGVISFQSHYCVYIRPCFIALKVCVVQRLLLPAPPQNLWLGSSRVPHTRSTTWVFWKESPTPLFVLHALVEAHPDYELLQKQFVSNWKKQNARRVAVVRIIKIQVRNAWRRRQRQREGRVTLLACFR